jgi:hypothetical protein
VRRLGGELDVSLEDVVRLERVAQLAIRRLGIADRKKSEPSVLARMALEGEGHGRAPG